MEATSTMKIRICQTRANWMLSNSSAFQRALTARDFTEGAELLTDLSGNVDGFRETPVADLLGLVCQ
jgi:hypothetical protein